MHVYKYYNAQIRHEFELEHVFESYLSLCLCAGFPFGKLPVLDLLVDGKPVRLWQSRAIAGFLARNFGMN